MAIRVKSRAKLTAMTVFALYAFTSAGLTRDNSNCQKSSKVPLKAGDQITSIYFSDADSGRANGVCFRYYNIDAAETGPVGTRGGAQCEQERDKGLKDKSWMINQTNGHYLVVTAVYGFDRYHRQLIEIDINGETLGELALSKGIYFSWRHKGGRPLEPKPQYCESGKLNWLRRK